jgi:hypothetical protein
MRHALIGLFEEPVPASFKAGRAVLESILGSNDLPTDKPILCFSSNEHLRSLIKPGASPVVWETKDRLNARCKSVVDTIKGAGQELLMDLIGTNKYIPLHTPFFWQIPVHTSTYQYIPVHTAFYIPVHTCTYYVFNSTY